MACHFFLPVLELFLLCINKGAFAPFGWVAPLFFRVFPLPFFRGRRSRGILSRVRRSPLPEGFLVFAHRLGLLSAYAGLTQAGLPIDAVTRRRAPHFPPEGQGGPQDATAPEGAPYPSPRWGVRGGAQAKAVAAGGGGRRESRAQWQPIFVHKKNQPSRAVLLLLLTAGLFYAKK